MYFFMPTKIICAVRMSDNTRVQSNVSMAAFDVVLHSASADSANISWIVRKDKFS